MIKKLPTTCPSCSSTLAVKELYCEACETTVAGQFNLPSFSQLERSDQEFVLEFVLASGSLKVMAQKMGLSYPSVRNRLDDIIEKLQKISPDG